MKESFYEGLLNLMQVETLTLSHCSMQAMCQECSQPCDCPAESPLCPVGTSLVLDGCSCCKVCARQAGEPCSFLEPCDHHKDLYCDYGVLSDTETGICIGEYMGAMLCFGM